MTSNGQNIDEFEPLGTATEKVLDIRGRKRLPGRRISVTLNENFSVEAREKSDVHHRAFQGIKLDHVLCFREERVVQNDWAISWQNRRFPLSEQHQRFTLVFALDSAIMAAFKNLL